MFYDFPQDFKKFEPAPGFLVRVVSGQNIMFSHVTLQPNAVAPLHNHVEEQMGLILEGEMEVTIEGETRVMKKGNFLKHLRTDIIALIFGKKEINGSQILG